MAIIQITQILLRRGLETELTPTSLETGEMGFAVDTGRLFIGSDPDHDGPWSARGTSPYANVEVLTEAAVTTYARLFDRMHRTAGPIGLSEGLGDRTPYLKGVLAASTSSWSPVMVDRLNVATGTFEGVTEPLVLSTTAAVGGHIEYFIATSTNLVRTGNIILIHNGNLDVDVGESYDEYVSYPYVPGSTSVLSSVAYPGNIQFRILRVTDSPGVYRIRLEYKNASTDTVDFYFRASVAVPLMP